ncbi:hypothetical protein GYMLUDRAFT_685752 [Collybiopsis luxurians FD-317 M1]|uniref:RING-type domain-containing protein n=1 Tax=Collybiopsis luxurians FD-317 M1 TaxID=944289 RepID=A0A0D0C9L9_9AGAR|nr:hypothetical protein GYMLUDRAFT_685752 [Collybiopsis luxurians FD-317 M1]
MNCLYFRIVFIVLRCVYLSNPERSNSLRGSNSTLPAPLVNVTMVDFHCDICHENFPLDAFFFSTCGHGFCGTCTRSLGKYKQCPSCRQPRYKSQLHKLFITPAETAVDVERQAQSLMKLMTNLRPNSEYSSAQEVADGMKNMTGKLKNTNEAVANKLLSVAKDMQDRLLPIYFVMQLEHDEKRALRNKVDLWQPKITQVKASTAEVAKLTKELEKARRLQNQMLAQLEKEWAENKKLRKDVVDERRRRKEMEVLVLELIEENENAAKRAKTAREVLRAFSKGSSSNRGRVLMIQD